MARSIRLQDPVVLGASTVTQRIEECVDLGPDADSITLQVRKLGSGAAIITLQHAPVLAEDAFEGLSSASDMTSTSKDSLWFAGVQQYLRWKATSVSGGPTVVIDVLARANVVQRTTYFQLQQPTTLTTSTSQPVEQAIDIESARTVTVQVRCTIAGAASTKVVLQHAPVLDEDAFEDVKAVFTGGAPSFTIDSIGLSTKTFSNLHRYLRWRGVRTGSPNAMFAIDIIARGL